MNRFLLGAAALVLGLVLSGEAQAGGKGGSGHSHGRSNHSHNSRYRYSHRGHGYRHNGYGHYHHRYSYSRYGYNYSYPSYGYSYPSYSYQYNYYFPSDGYDSFDDHDFRRHERSRDRFGREGSRRPGGNGRRVK